MLRACGHVCDILRQTKPSFDIARMTAVFSVLVPVGVEHFPTGRADEIVHRLPLDVSDMGVPPYVPAMVAAKLLFPPSRVLNHFHAAIFAMSYRQPLYGYLYSRLSIQVFLLQTVTPTE